MDSMRRIRSEHTGAGQALPAQGGPLVVSGRRGQIGHVRHRGVSMAIHAFSCPRGRGRRARYAAAALGAVAVLAFGAFAPAAAQAATPKTLGAAASYARTQAASDTTIKAYRPPECPRAPGLSFCFNPYITSVSPTRGSASGGTLVTITGAYYSLSANAVWFGGLPATDVTRVSASVVTAVAPAQASGVVQLQLGFTGGQKTVGEVPQDEYTYLAPAPAVTGVSSAAGPAGRRHGGDGDGQRVHRSFGGDVRVGGRHQLHGEL